MFGVKSSPFIALVFIGFVNSICLPSDPIPICFTQSEFDDAFNITRHQISVMEEFLIAHYDEDGVALNHHDPAFDHFKTSDIPSDALEDNRIATAINVALTVLKSAKNLTKSQLEFCVQKISLNEICTPKIANCKASETSYYRFDGQCNNVINPLWGSKQSPIIRLLKNGFDDGINPNESEESARDDSVIANHAKGISDQTVQEVHNDMSTMMGQILTHEMLQTKKTQVFSKAGKGGFNCCNPTKNETLDQVIKINKYCMPIKVKTSDSCYQGNVKCLNYIKTLKAIDDCGLHETPMPINFHTPYIDAELIYNEISTKHLHDNGGKFDFDNDEKMKEILVGYDVRSMQLPGLFLYLSFFAHLHNMCFDEMKRIHGQNSNDEISFECRRITTAIYQRIFVDFVAHLLPGPQASKINGLRKCYDPSHNPQVSLEFNLSLRFFHYFLRQKMFVYDEEFFAVKNGLRGKSPSEVDFPDLIDNLTFYTDNQCGLTHGLLDTSWNLGGLQSNIHCNFFAPNKTSLGIDLRSLDYQLGKEDGQPSLTEILREIWKIDKCDEEFTIKDMINHDDNTRRMFMDRYDNKLSKVGFTIATDFEDRRGNLIGPTVAHVITEQFERTICGDRFYFENLDNFREDQKEAIRQWTLFDLICLVHDCKDTRIQQTATSSPGFGNLKSTCPSKTELIQRLTKLADWF